MPRDLFRLFFTERIRGALAKTTWYGELMSQPRLTGYGTGPEPLPIADVRISSVIISSVPVTDNSHDLLYAKPGIAVEVRRSASGRLEIVGLAKRGVGVIQEVSLDIATGVASVTMTQDYASRTVTLGELASATTGGFGVTPLQALILTNNVTGSIINVVL